MNMPPKKRGSTGTAGGRAPDLKKRRQGTRRENDGAATRSRQVQNADPRDPDDDVVIEPEEEEQNDSVSEEEEDKTAVSFDQVQAEMVDAIQSISKPVYPPPPSPALDKDDLIVKKSGTPDGDLSKGESEEEQESSDVGCQVGFYHSLQRDLIREKLIKCIIKMKGRQAKEVSSVKRKQWCIICGELAYYHCCRNANYCSLYCQTEHWFNEHKKVCTRVNMRRN